MQNTYEEYAVLEAKIKDLKNQQDSMRVKILEEMVNNEEKKIDTPFGSFSVSMRKTWTYTEKVEKAEEEFKALKAKEESCGDATFEETPSLRFTSAKI